MKQKKSSLGGGLYRERIEKNIKLLNLKGPVPHSGEAAARQGRKKEVPFYSAGEEGEKG